MTWPELQGVGAAAGRFGGAAGEGDRRCQSIEVGADREADPIRAARRAR
ncbi:MAG: hypothetical protein R3E53_16425 [Myxococcota bacterium]